MLIKYTSPGVPDCSQGNEFFDFSLVHPDNRRPVDYPSRGEALIALAAIVQRKAHGPAQTLFENAPNDGRAKLYVIWRLLMLRRLHASLFLHGGYTPLTASGMHAANVVAYARRYAGSGVITIAGRMFGALGLVAGALPCGEATWGDTEVALTFLGEGTVLKNAFSGEAVKVTAGKLRVAAALNLFPGAVFEYDRGEIGAASG